MQVFAYVSTSMPLQMNNIQYQSVLLAITDLPFAEEAWRHIPCAICNYLGWPTYEVMWLTCRSVRRWAIDHDEQEVRDAEAADGPRKQEGVPMFLGPRMGEWARTVDKRSAAKPTRAEDVVLLWTMDSLGSTVVSPICLYACPVRMHSFSRESSLIESLIELCSYKQKQQTSMPPSVSLTGTIDLDKQWYGWRSKLNNSFWTFFSHKEICWELVQKCIVVHAVSEKTIDH